MGRRRIECFTVDVDGEPVLVRGDAGMDAKARAALTEVIRAVRAATDTTQADLDLADYNGGTDG